jgi:hypothetical protein
MKNHREGKKTMNQTSLRHLSGKIGILQIVIITLVVITAIIHLQRGISMSAGGIGGGPPVPRPGFTGTPGAFPGGPGGGAPGGQPGGPGDGAHGASGMAILQWIPLPLSTLFILNGICYLVLIIALYLPPLYRFQRIVRWLLIIFTAVTFILYFLVNGFHLQTISLTDKTAEIALIILLLIDDRQSVRYRRSEVPHEAPIE